jgi:hypothetical protein
MTQAEPALSAPKKRFARQKSPERKGRIVMTSIASSSPAVDHHREHGLLADIAAFWRGFFASVSDPYRPELHYMRGPGPACRAKQMAALQPRSS